eukprot:g9519.t1
MADDSGLGTPAESPLAPAILRGLGDRSYDKRKNAALEIEALIKTLEDNNETDRICSIIVLLGQDFATSTNPNHRKGGLIGLAASSIGLMSATKLYLDALLPPVLHCLDDAESRVRYYACESLYNIAKVARGDILTYFNQIFVGLCKLFADVDVDVKNGSNLLNRLIKDIVTESESFDVERFIPLLQKYIRRANPYIRQLLVGWITVLDSVPDINMIDWLPDFLDGLLNMLSDGNREIRQAADTAVSDFLTEIKASSFVEFGSMVPILVGHCNSKDRFNRLTAVQWVHEFIKLGGERLGPFFSELLGAITNCISDTDPVVRERAGEANKDLLELVQGSNQDLELSPLLKTVKVGLLNHHVPTKMAALEWINMLLEKSPSDMGRFIQELLPSLLNTLTDEADDVVLMNLQVLARISLNEEQFNHVLEEILQLFSQQRRLLETRGGLIIRKLCVLLQPKTIYVALASVLQTNSDLAFIGVMVEALNLILLTAAELGDLRQALRLSTRSDASPEDRELFAALFACWCHNPVATFSLCLLAQAYEVSAELVKEVAEVEISVGFLMQVDKLVQLLESPIFLRLRLQLLDVDSPSYPALLKSLYGILMLLPQSAAFKTLRDRLATACSLNQNLAALPSSSSSSSSLSSTSATAVTSTARGERVQTAQTALTRRGKGRTQDVSALLSKFKTAQERHVQARREAFRKKSLQSDASTTTAEK